MTATVRSRCPARAAGSAGGAPASSLGLAVRGADRSCTWSVFFVLPLLLVARMSASDWTAPARASRGINLPDNYTSISDNALFWPAVWFTIEYTVLVTVLLRRAWASASPSLVQEGGRWVGFLRTSFLIPSALGLASASLLFWGLYSGSIGPLTPLIDGLNGLLRGLGIVERARSRFLGIAEHGPALDRRAHRLEVRGFYMLILLVGLQAIPQEVYEAAAIDGASRWQTFRRVTLPLLRPSLALALILCITGSLLAFDQFYILTKGGPDNSTVTVVQLIYREAFQRQNLGHRGRAVDRRPGGAAGPQRPPVPRPARQRRRLRDRRCAATTSDADALLRPDGRAGHRLPVPDHLERRRVGESASRAPAQVVGYGLGNYTTLLNFGPACRSTC